MAVLDPVIFRELPVIQKIIADEIWLEGERRGCWVPPDDPVVCENVCQIVLRIGAALRATLMNSTDALEVARVEPIPSTDHSHAA